MPDGAAFLGLSLCGLNSVPMPDQLAGAVRRDLGSILILGAGTGKLPCYPSHSLSAGRLPNGRRDETRNRSDDFRCAVRAPRPFGYLKAL